MQKTMKNWRLEYKKSRNWRKPNDQALRRVKNDEEDGNQEMKLERPHSLKETQRDLCPGERSEQAAEWKRSLCPAKACVPIQIEAREMVFLPPCELRREGERKRKQAGGKEETDKITPREKEYKGESE